MVEILNLRSSHSDQAVEKSNPLADQLVAGLKCTERIVPGSNKEDEAFAYSKEITTMVLYDDKGLDIYDNITQTDDYYLYGSELAILTKYGPAIAQRLFCSGSLPTDEDVPALGTSASDSSSSSSEGSPERKEKEEKEEVEEDEEESSYQRDLKTVGKEKWGDGRVGKNNFGVNGNLGLEDKQDSSTASVIELGAGSLKKTSVLLRALSDTLLKTGTLSGLNYYALDLEHGQLVSTLNQLETNLGDAVTTKSDNQAANTKEKEKVIPKIVAKGICASYDDALPYLKDGKYDSSNKAHKERKTILFLGSSIGNYGRTGAIEFLKKISNDAMTPGDTLLIGIDGCDDKEIIEKAYNDSKGVTRDFILNGVDHVDRILGGVGLAQEQFEYVNRYNQPMGRHEAYIRAKKDRTIQVGQEKIHFASGELIRIERSYKYSPLEAADLLSSAGLRVVQKWTDDERTGGYSLYLVEKPLFFYPSTLEALEKGKNPFGLPSLAEWDALWKSWDCVTLSMIPRDLLHTKPIDLRHICLFYLGHIPGFLDIHMSRYLQEPYTEPRHYPEMFERGIDPNMEDPSKVHAHSVVPTKMEDWPVVDEIVAYRDRVRARLYDVYEKRLTDPAKIDKRLARTMGMVYEHEVMHLETLLYMAAQIPPGKLLAAPSFTKPDWEALSRQWDRQVEAESRPTRNLISSYSASTISVGHNDFDHLDKETAYDPAHTFGWDNETPKREVPVPAFNISLLPISNADYLRFYQSAGSDEEKKKELLPGSWMPMESGTFGVKVLAEPGVVPIEIAKDWPCMASGKQLESYAKSVGGRLPTEPELRRYMVDNPVDHVGANIGFANWHAVPARLPATLRNGQKSGASNGGIWEWTCSNFEAHEGWRAAELYPDYSRDFHDGCHWIMLGGSFATIPRVAGRTTFTNWYQAGYPYVFAGARVAYDA